MKVLTVFGTRPEAIKMCVLVNKLNSDSRFEHKFCSTGQHQEMLNQVLDLFNIKKDYELNVMDPILNKMCSNVMRNIHDVYLDFNPDMVLVHGDTSSASMAALAAFHMGIKIGHVEAGLRTGNIKKPFPEELNRIIIDRVSDVCFAPTERNKKTLLLEGINEDKILVTGNTGIDALLCINDDQHASNEIKKLFSSEKRIILVTGHRRENFGEGFENICSALIEIAEHNKDVRIIYPVHLNPNVKNVVEKRLENIENITLCSPMDYPNFVYAMKRSYLILSDSGGVQEEAPTFGKPVLVMRSETERQEAVDAGCVSLVGSEREKIVSFVKVLLNDKNVYNKMSESKNPYGDGKASDRIINYLLNLNIL